MKNLEFHVALHGSIKVSKTFEQAVETATIHAIGTGMMVYVDVIAHSESAARKFGGDSGAEAYREDPDASVFHRIGIRAEDFGRIA